MIDSVLLRSTMKSKHASVTFMALSLGITPPTFYSKLRNDSFSVPEKECIKKLLQLTEKEYNMIFFAQNVECETT